MTARPLPDIFDLGYESCLTCIETFRERGLEIMEYFEPKTLGDALSLLAQHGAEAKVIAGGTDVMVDIKFKEEPGSLVNIKKIPGLTGIKENGASLRIGALTTIRELETSALVRDKLPVLWSAAHQFASLQVRNTATIGGNICRASPSGETLTPLLVLEAKAKLAFSEGEKSEPFSCVLSRSRKEQRRRQRLVNRNRRADSAGRQQRRLLKACRARRHGYRHGRRRGDAHAGRGQE